MTQCDKKSSYMAEAFQLAQNAAQLDEVPIGAVVVDRATGDIIGRGQNRTIEWHDPSAHAEILAIREACEKKQSQRIPDCDVYVTLEPCAMCAAAISYARIHTLYYAASDPKSGGIHQGPKIYDHATIHHKPVIEGGLMGQECSILLTDFFRQKRKDKK